MKVFLEYTAAAALLALTCLSAYAETGMPDAEPHLRFKKSVVIRDIDSGRAHAEKHVVKKGEHIWKILREQFNMTDTNINFFCKIARAVNPEIEDINVIEPNQNILLPFKFIPADGTDNRTIMVQAQDHHYVVKPNEHLARILRTRYDLSDTVIFSRITQSLIRDANPGIADLNHISPGQRITVPREVFAMRQFIDNDIMPSDIANAQPIQKKAEELTLVPDTQFADEEPAPAMSFTEEPLNDEEIEIKRMLSQMTRGFDGTDNSTGRALLGADNQSLDYSRFPAYNFPWGKKVVLDYGNRLNDAARSGIAATWNDAEVVSVNARDDMETIIGRVLDVCGFYKVEKDADYTVNRDAVQLSVTGNWIVFKDSSLRNVFIVNVSKDGTPTMSPSLRSYLSGIGLEVMDIGADDDSSGNVSTPREVPSGQETLTEAAAVTDTILRLLTITYETEYNTNIFQNMYSGFTLEVLADRMFILNGETRLIDFNNLPGRIVTIIEQQGFKLLQIHPGIDSLDDTAGRVLEFCNADFQPPPATLSFDQGSRNNVTLTVPAYVVQAPGGKALLTGAVIEPSIAAFLHEMDVTVINYNNAPANN